MTPLHINSYTLTSALGAGIAATRESISQNRSGLSNDKWYDSELDTWLGRVRPLDESDIPVEPEWRSRNNRLAKLGAEQDDFGPQLAASIVRFGADRIGLVCGTSTSSIGRSEEGYRQLIDGDRFAPDFRQEHVHNPHAPGAYLNQLLGIAGPCLTISTACSSSGKAFAAAARWLELNLVDAVVVCGVDSLCQSVIYGFNSLQLVDTELCRPFDQQRGGINLGEAAGFVLLSREDLGNSQAKLLGYGESSDAFHMSSAHPEGLGAELAMRASMGRANLRFSELDYINLHGTGTRANDDIESRICNKLLTDNVRASSTKGWTGHTLGAAGICEAVLTIDAITTGILPGNINTQTPEQNIASNLILETTSGNIRHAMSNSFGFGGNNCSLIFGAA
jgi:3-oxoacyl-[acyl-carrier-protein] synthase-1